MSNTELWDSVFTTDAAATKKFVKGGGFSGTAIKPYYLIHRATEKFGAIGIGWGFEEIQNKVEFGIWCSLVKLWYVYNGQRGECQQWGATVMAGKNKNGDFVDEEAAKKAVTDAVTKCLSYIGFAGDVHSGLFDDSKYIEKQKAEEPKNEKSTLFANSQLRKSYCETVIDRFENAPTNAELAAELEVYLPKLKDMADSPNQWDREAAEEIRKRYKLALTKLEEKAAIEASFPQDFINAGTPAFLRKAQ